MANAKKVKVTFGENPPRVKVIALPIASARSDLENFREALLAELLFDGSIKILGGSSKTSVDDILVYHFDIDFEELVEVTKLFEIPHLYSLIVKVQASGEANSKTVL